MPADDETPMTDERWEKMAPGEKLEYQISHKADLKFKRWYLRRIDRSTPAGRLEHRILKAFRPRKYEKRKPLAPDKALKSYDPGTVYKVLKHLGTPATLSKLLNAPDRLNRSLTANSLRQYLDILLTRGYITITDAKFDRKNYPNNTIPRKRLSLKYVSTRDGKTYVKRYDKVLEMLSEFNPEHRIDRL